MRFETVERSKTNQAKDQMGPRLAKVSNLEPFSGFLGFSVLQRHTDKEFTMN